MMDVSATVVRNLTSLAIASSFLFFILRRAQICQIRRVGGVALAERARIAKPWPLAEIHDDARQLDSRRQPYHGARETLDVQSRANDCEMDDTLVERKSNLPAWDKFVGFYYSASCLWNSLMAIKYLIICLLDMGALNDRFGYLDCYLLGRTALNPRVVGLLKYASLCVFCFHCLYHSILLGKRKLSMRIPCMEFLMMHPDTVNAYNCQQLSSPPNAGPAPSPNYKYCSLLSYKNFFVGLRDQQLHPSGSYRTRPNRSLEAWHELARLLTLGMGWALFSFVALTPPFWALQLPMILTRPGFEVSYSVCLKWIAKQESRADWAHIYDVPSNYSYDPDKRNRFFLTFNERFVDANAYHTIRAALDMVSNVTFNSQLWIALSVFPVISAMVSADICLCCRHIDAAIKQLISDYQEIETLRLISSSSEPYRRPSRLQCSARKNGAGIHASQAERVTEVQAMVVDLFGQLREYSTHTIYYMCFCTVIWYIYSFICSSWLFMPAGQHESSTLESYFIEATTTTLFLVIMGLYARARHACAQLYKSIATMVSLEGLEVEGRRRWLVIMKHFTPVPLHCFSFFNTLELSWMFALKLTAWLFSALFVLSNFSVSHGPRLGLATAASPKQ